MLNRIICLISMVSNAPLMVFFQDKMLTPDNNKISIAKRYLIFTGLFLQLGIVRVFAGNFLWPAAAYGFYIIGTVWLLRRCYQESMLIKMMVWIILMSLSIAGDGIFEGIFFLVTREIIVADYSQPKAAFCCAMVLPITLVLSIFTVRIWDKAYKKRQSPGNTVVILLFCVLPVIIVLLGVMTFSHAGEDSISQYMLICSAIAFMSVMMILMLCLQYDRAAAQRELAEIQRQSELERAHYAAVEEKREALARIRHDYRNVLNTAIILMEGENQEKAKQLLTEMTEKINATSEYPFCAIPVINAILTEKKHVCNEQGILLKTELLLPIVLPVDDFDLCIILGNLIDNAIRACGGKKVGKDSEVTMETTADLMEDSPEICLFAGEVQGYLVIKCKNPVFPETEEKKGSGYGQKILKSLAEKYQGNFLIEKQDGYYTAQISLFLGGEQPGETGAKTGETGKRGTSGI